jgi:hypothetical protein
LFSKPCAFQARQRLRREIMHIEELPTVTI